MKWSIAGLVVLGVVAAISAALLMMFFTNRNAGGREATGEITVLVATHDLPAMSIVDSTGIETRKIPAGKAPDQAVTSTVEAVGKILKSDVTKGQALDRNMFVTENNAQLAASLPPGKRAIAISLSDFAGLDGVLYPGSVVDVLLTTNANGPTKGTSRTVLEKIKVLAVDRQTIIGKDSEKKTEADDHRGQNARRVTLLVTSQEATKLCQAMNAGTLTLALRNPMDTGASYAEAALPLPGDVPPPAPDTSADAVPTTNPAPVAAVAPRPAPKPPWEVTVKNGSNIETVNFASDTDSGKVSKEPN